MPLSPPARERTAALWYLFSLAVVVTLVALGHLAARMAAARIRDCPDPYPPGVLSQEPQGETVFIARPDGTRIRAVAAGQGPVVVLAHGYGLTLREWGVLWDQLVRSGNRVIAFDQ